jgi:hypothetical protein
MRFSTNVLRSWRNDTWNERIDTDQKTCCGLRPNTSYVNRDRSKPAFNSKSRIVSKQNCRAKVNHHVYRSVPPRMERLSLRKGPFR